MAYDLIPILICIVIFAAILAVIFFMRFNDQINNRKRMKLIRAYKASPVRVAGAPLMAHGKAGSAGLVMPTGGEPVAFYAAFIMSRGCTLIRGFGDQKLLPSRSSFKIFTTSGDFPVTDAGRSYHVSIISALERYYQGAARFSEKHRQLAILDGIPETVFDDAINFEAGIQALTEIFSIATSGTSVTSTIDFRVHTFTQGRDVPPAIADMLKGKIIRPLPGEEITVAEFYIPLTKSVWVFGESDGTDTIRYGEKGTMLLVSYVDPATAGV